MGEEEGREVTDEGREEEDGREGRRERWTPRREARWEEGRYPLARQCTAHTRSLGRHGHHFPVLTLVLASSLLPLQSLPPPHLLSKASLNSPVSELEVESLAWWGWWACGLVVPVWAPLRPGRGRLGPQAAAPPCGRGTPGTPPPPLSSTSPPPPLPPPGRRRRGSGPPGPGTPGAPCPPPPPGPPWGVCFRVDLFLAPGLFP